MTGRSSRWRAIRSCRERRPESAVAARTTNRPAMRSVEASNWQSGSPSSARPVRSFLEGLLAQSRYGKNQAERVLALVAVYPRQDVLAALERAVQLRRVLAWRPCSESSRHGASPRRHWMRWPTTIEPIWMGCSIAIRRLPVPPPIIKTCCARSPRMAKRSHPHGKRSPNVPNRATTTVKKRSLHDDVTAAL